MSETAKSHFLFQEVSSIVGIKPYVLRFWETEFPEINPTNGENGQKVYSKEDLETVLKIKNLLFEQKLSIQAAKSALRGEDYEVAKEIRVAPAQVERVKGHLATASVQDLTRVMERLQTIKTKYHW